MTNDDNLKLIAGILMIAIIAAVLTEAVWQDSQKIYDADGQWLPQYQPLEQLDDCSLSHREH